MVKLVDLGVFGRLWRAGLNLAVSLAVAVLLASAPLAAQDQNNEYRLGAGDQLRITVFGQADLSGQFEVSNDGRIAFPLIGEVRAADLTPQELEKAITAKLKPDYLKDPQLSVEVINYRPFYIIGEVKNPGSYAYVGGMRVVNAVAMAGGYTYRAKENNLLITRAGGNGKKEAADQNTAVRPGDVIEVPERYF
jgi:polysaccharide biosynthesis/export protein VpsN